MLKGKDEEANDSQMSKHVLSPIVDGGVCIPGETIVNTPGIKEKRNTPSKVINYIKDFRVYDPS